MENNEYFNVNEGEELEMVEVKTIWGKIYCPLRKIFQQDIIPITPPLLIF
jgi:hypothetical protein